MLNSPKSDGNAKEYTEESPIDTKPCSLVQSYTPAWSNANNSKEPTYITYGENLEPTLRQRFYEACHWATLPYGQNNRRP